MSAQTVLCSVQWLNVLQDPGLHNSHFRVPCALAGFVCLGYNAAMSALFVHRRQSSQPRHARHEVAKPALLEA